MAALITVGSVDIALAFDSNVEYFGKSGIIFEKAVCAWWWGKGDESRSLFFNRIPGVPVSNRSDGTY